MRPWRLASTSERKFTPDTFKVQPRTAVGAEQGNLSAKVLFVRSRNKQPGTSPKPDRKCAVQPTNFLAITVALCPPKPKELFTTKSTGIWRAVFGT